MLSPMTDTPVTVVQATDSAAVLFCEADSADGSALLQWHDRLRIW
jgi:hypothetical protein